MVRDSIGSDTIMYTFVIPDLTSKDTQNSVIIRDIVMTSLSTMGKTTCRVVTNGRSTDHVFEVVILSHVPLCS